ncbi:MAG TPA: PVC-type heme-binding CxxCH protein, partial [Pirellulales bacterium]|nr:PVC-type heme-binding CxxCH protein [Pirellulales bacterium]
MRIYLGVLAIVCGLAGNARAEEAAPPLKALFLGDQGHHRPSERAAQLIPVMAGRGIEIVYTENVAELNPKTLAGYDALILYANIDRIEPREAKALLDYVSGGGGFVPLHCASFCFRNSAEVIALIGAQFQRHGTGTFDTKVVAPDHPIMKGLEPFTTWDETYVHEKHNEKDRTVLQVRTEGNGQEPWTWVRTHGKGRVFYTAYGHDGRTWSQPGFHALVERGIRWASQKGEVFDSNYHKRSDTKPFEYAKAVLPNYLPNQRWGTQGKPLDTMQLPVEPAESVKHMQLPRGFEPQLFAAEPDIAKPIALAWDHRGRLWIAETVDYPNDMQRSGEGHDRIKICEDTDGDGRADKFTVFAEQLSIPTSLAFARGGIVVQQAPETLFLKDSDGDDKADVREVLFTGWGTGDTHAGPSNLRWGFDNWLWGIMGYSGFRGTVGGEEHAARQGFYRFKTDGSKFEFLRNTNNNSWGVGFSEEGLVFGSTANGCPSVYLPIPNRYYEAVRGWSPQVLQSIAASNDFYPVTDKVRQVDNHGGFTAAAGHALYTARTYPKWYWNRTAFVTEPTGHLAATFLLEPRGADFTADYGWNLLASDDEWTSPVAAEVGPDGHVWVIDWYNYIVQHNPTPEGFKTGKGAAYETELRDKTHGRIYRLVYKDAPAAERFELDPNDAAGLVAALGRDNQLWRMHAQRLLVERGKTDVAADLIKLVQNQSVDEIG